MEISSVTEKEERRKLLGKIHALAREIFGFGLGRATQDDSNYRDWLEKHFRERSCVKMNNETLLEVANFLQLQKNGQMTNPEIITGDITYAQLKKIACLCHLMGWKDSYDKRLRSFCERTITQKYWSVEFDVSLLRKSDASKVINGLENWLSQIKRRFECYERE